MGGKFKCCSRLFSPLCRRACPAASPAIARAMCVVSRGNWNSRASFRPRMPVYFRRVQENHSWKSDRILNIFTKAKSQKKHTLEVMWGPFFSVSRPLFSCELPLVRIVGRFGLPAHNHLRTPLHCVSPARRVLSARVAASSRRGTRP